MILTLLATVAVFFSPKGGATDQILVQVAKAKQSIHVQAYAFGSNPIAGALIGAKTRGVDVRVIFDKKWRAEMIRNKRPLTAEDKIAASGIPTLIDSAHAIAHNKVMVIDGIIVITGSFNFTGQAETSNAENLLIIRDRKVASKYEANWQTHATHSLAL